MDLKLEMFHNEAENVSFEAGQAIFHEGDSGDTMFVILEGEVEISLGGEVVETLVAGQPFGEMALIDQTPRLVTAIAEGADCARGDSARALPLHGPGDALLRGADHEGDGRAPADSERLAHVARVRPVASQTTPTPEQGLPACTAPAARGLIDAWPMRPQRCR